MTNLLLDAVQSLNALLGHDPDRLLALAAWLWQRGDRVITPADLARDYPALDLAYAPLTYRLLVWVGALRETVEEVPALLALFNLVSSLMYRIKYTLIRFGQNVFRWKM